MNNLKKHNKFKLKEDKILKKKVRNLAGYITHNSNGIYNIWDLLIDFKFKNDKDYTTIKEKINNLVDLLNSDKNTDELWNRDFEKAIWYML